MTKKRILVVDDEEAILFAYKKLLKTDNVDIDVSSNFEGAISLINSNDYNAVFSDIRLGGVGETEGLSILKYIIERRPNMKVIIMTGYGSDEIKAQALKMGACCYLEKPVESTKIFLILSDLGIS